MAGAAKGGSSAQLVLAETVAMPANNLLLIFKLEVAQPAAVGA